MQRPFRLNSYTPTAITFPSKVVPDYAALPLVPVCSQTSTPLYAKHEKHNQCTRYTGITTLQQYSSIISIISIHLYLVRL